MKIVSLNCRGLGERSKRRDVFDFIKRTNANIYCLQDTHFIFENEEDVLNEWGGRGVFSYKSSNARGFEDWF